MPTSLQPPPSGAPAASTGLRGYGARTFYSLRIPDFRVLWIGNVGTMLGQWVQFAAQGYLVFHLTGSPFQVGAVGFVRGISAVIVSPFAGTIADRFSRRSTLMVMTTRYPNLTTTSMTPGISLLTNPLNTTAAMST